MLALSAVVIDEFDPNLLTMAEAARLIPSTRRRNRARTTNPETVRDWCIQGRRGIRLASIVRNGQRMTSAEAVREFVRRTSQYLPRNGKSRQ